VLADEINRASPKTQSGLLEAMQERQVTVDGVTYPLPRPFMVLATQNPVDMSGTYPLPEAQMDRFLMQISMGYPTADQEALIISDRKGVDPMASVEAVASPAEILELQKAIEEIHVDDAVKQYIVDLVCATRESSMIALAASPRASLALMRAACAAALLDGRSYVIPGDVSEMYEAIVSHRLMLAPEAKMERLTASAVLADIKDTVKAPIVK
jgi:MoxR-like ATPase